MVGHLRFDYKPIELPQKDGGHSLKELLEIERLSPNGCDLTEYYNGSYRVALAMQQLQKAVEKEVADPKSTIDLFPEGEKAYNKVLEAAWAAPELRVDVSEAKRTLGRETGEVDKHGQTDMDKLLVHRKAAHDPLAMARKQVIDAMIEHNFTFCDPTNSTIHVQKLMLLMAQNAQMKQERGQSPAAAAL